MKRVSTVNPMAPAPGLCVARGKPLQWGLMAAACCILFLTSAGCDVAGLAAQALPPPTVPPKYVGLKGQSVAIMVWADRGLLADWPNLQIDVTRAIQQKIHAAQKDNPKQLKDVHFPVSPASVVRYQEDHPETEASRVEDLAVQLGVSRLIYVEIQGFQTRSDQAVDLFRGSVSASLKVVEVAAGKGKIAYAEDEVRDTYPDKSPEEGIPNATDFQIYRGTLEKVTTDIAQRFFPHESDQDASHDAPSSDAAHQDAPL